MPAHVRAGAGHRRPSPSRSYVPPPGRREAPSVRFAKDSSPSYGKPRSSHDRYRPQSPGSGYRPYSPNGSYSSYSSNSASSVAYPTSPQAAYLRAINSRAARLRTAPPQAGPSGTTPSWAAPPQAAPTRADAPWPVPPQVPIPQRGPRRLTPREKEILGYPPESQEVVTLTALQVAILAPRWSREEGAPEGGGPGSW